MNASSRMFEMAKVMKNDTEIEVEEEEQLVEDGELGPLSDRQVSS